MRRDRAGNLFHGKRVHDAKLGLRTSCKEVQVGNAKVSRTGQTVASFAPTRLKDVAGRLKYTGRPKTLEEMNRAIAREVGHGGARPILMS